ncbi:porin, partial [Nostoc sp. 3335mG]
AAPPAVETPASASGLEDCRVHLAELSARNAILFRSGAAVLVEGADPVLAAIAEAVSHCPAASIDIAGHTDADGDAEANLALSVARAEAVVNALIALGVAPERLYAVGYGESQPVGDNATAAGKAQNRRIVVSVRSES